MKCCSSSIFVCRLKFTGLWWAKRILWSCFFFFYFSFSYPLPRGPKSKGRSRRLVYPTKKEKKKKKNKDSQTTERHHFRFRSCVVYIYCRVLLTWHACSNGSQTVCICLVYMGRDRDWIDPTVCGPFLLPAEAWGFPSSVQKCGTWHTLVTPTAARWRTALPGQFRNRVLASLFLSPKSDLEILLQQFRSASFHLLPLSPHRLRRAILRCSAIVALWSSLKCFWLDLSTVG